MPVRTFKRKLGPKKRDRDKGLPIRKKVCRFCMDKVNTIDYKDVRRLEAFIGGRGKIVSTRVSGNCAKHQRQVARAIKRARFLGLAPYVSR